MDDTLTQLFDTDPLELTNDQIDVICDSLREQRQRWVMEEKAAAASGRKPKSPELKAKVKKLSVNDLGL